MRRSIGWLLAAATLAACAARGGEIPAAAPRPIFREITVGSGQRIALGAPVPANVRPLVQPAGERELRLRPGTFGDADSITLALDAEGRVRSMRFVYAPGTNYDAIVADYLDDLGPPARRTGGGGQRTTRWEDARTRFEVFARGTVVGSVLSDRSDSTAATPTR